MAPTNEGLAAERTALAWTRTSLAVLADGGLLLLRHVTGQPGKLETVLGIVSAAIAVLVVLCGRLRAKQIRDGGTHPPGPSPAIVLTLGLTVAAFGLFVTVRLLAR